MFPPYEVAQTEDVEDGAPARNDRTREDCPQGGILPLSRCDEARGRCGSIINHLWCHLILLQEVVFSFLSPGFKAMILVK